VNHVLLEILLVWIVGIPALAIAGATMLARRRARLTRYDRVIPFHRGVRRSVLAASRSGARSHLRFPAA
jgi:hypothetical protein